MPFNEVEYRELNVDEAAWNELRLLKIRQRLEANAIESSCRTYKMVIRGRGPVESSEIVYHGSRFMSGEW